jgi:hypothetical protein
MPLPPFSGLCVRAGGVLDQVERTVCASHPRLGCWPGTRFLANAIRLLLYGFAYNLVNLFRLHLPQPWRSAQIESLRARLFKLGARVGQTARCIRVHLATGWPWQSLFQSAALAFNTRRSRIFRGPQLPCSRLTLRM